MVNFFEDERCDDDDDKLISYASFFFYIFVISMIVFILFPKTDIYSFTIGTISLLINFIIMIVILIKKCKHCYNNRRITTNRYIPLSRVEYL